MIWNIISSRNSCHQRREIPRGRLSKTSIGQGLRKVGLPPRCVLNIYTPAWAADHLPRRNCIRLRFHLPRLPKIQMCRLPVHLRAPFDPPPSINYPYLHRCHPDLRCHPRLASFLLHQEPFLKLQTPQRSLMDSRRYVYVQSDSDRMTYILGMMLHSRRSMQIYQTVASGSASSV